MYFLIKDEKFSEKYNEIWEKVSNNIKKDFENGPVYNKKYLKTIINLIIEKLTQISINTNFHNDNIPRERSQCICLWVTWIDFVFRTGDNYYPQVFLEECKYVVKEKKSCLSRLLAT